MGAALIFTDITGPVTLAARIHTTELNGFVAEQFFNGKIEAPSISVDGEVKVCWDLSSQMTSMTVPPCVLAPDISTTSATSSSISTEQALALSLVNVPTRAVCGSRWDGSEFCWRHR